MSIYGGMKQLILIVLGGCFLKLLFKTKLLWFFVSVTSGNVLKSVQKIKIHVIESWLNCVLFNTFYYNEYNIVFIERYEVSFNNTNNTQDDHIYPLSELNNV